MKKILLILLMFGLFITNTFAENIANLSSDKTNIGINDTLKVKAVISFEGNDISFKDVNLNGNFSVVGESNSTSMVSNIENINGQTKQTTKSQMEILLELKPLKSGNFEVGPAIFLSNGKEIKSNILKINVEKGSILNNFSGNNDSEKNKDFSMLKIFCYILGIFILVLGLNYAVIQGFKDKKVFEEKDVYIKSEENIIFPDVNDENFEVKLNDIFLDFLDKKYYISNIYSKTSKEILEEINDKNTNEIEEILKCFDMLKYSNTKEGKEDLLEKVKMLTFR